MMDVDDGTSVNDELGRAGRGRGVCIILLGKLICCSW